MDDIRISVMVVDPRTPVIVAHGSSARWTPEFTCQIFSPCALAETGDPIDA